MNSVTSWSASPGECCSFSGHSILRGSDMHRASLFLLALLTLFSQSGMAQVSLPPSPADWIYQNETPGMGVRIAAPGDVNGDEFGDFLVSEPGRVLLFLGSATGPATTPDW